MAESNQQGWRGPRLAVTDPAAIITRLDETPGDIYSLWRIAGLPTPVDIVNVTVAREPEQFELGKAYRYHTDIALDRDPKFMQRYASLVGKMHLSGHEIGQLRVARTTSHSPLVLFMTQVGVLDAFMYPEVETGNIALHGHTYPGREERQPRTVEYDNEARLQLLSFMRMSSLAVAMCATLGSRRHFTHFGRAFPPRGIDREWTVAEGALHKVGSLPVSSAVKAGESGPHDTAVTKVEVVKPKEKPVAEKPKVTLGKIEEPVGSLEQLGLELYAEQEVSKVIALFGKDEIVAGWATSAPRRVFLHGPPGSGKTSVAHAIATGIGAFVWKLGPEHIYGKWLGESEQRMAKVFAELAAIRVPTVLLLDEFQGLITAGEEGEDTASYVSAVRSIIRRGLEGEVANNPNVVVVATSNLDPDSELDESIARSGRFDVKLQMAHPDEAGRARIFAKTVATIIDNIGTAVEDITDIDPQREIFTMVSAADSVMDLSSFDPSALARATEGMSGADIRAIMQAALQAKAFEEVLTGKRPGPVSQADLLAAVERHKKQ